MDKHDEAIFRLMDKEDALRAAIESKFPSYWFVDQIEAVEEQFRWGLAWGRAAAERMGTDPSRIEVLRSEYIGMRFCCFGLSSLAMSTLDLLFSAKKQELRQGDAIDSRALALKSTPEFRLLRGIRNRSQHGRVLLGRMRHEVRNSEHPMGAGVAVHFDLEQNEWDAIVDDVAVAGREFYSTLKGVHRLWMLIEKASDAALVALGDARREFESAYAGELAQDAALIRELAGVEADFRKLGVGPLTSPYDRIVPTSL